MTVWELEQKLKSMPDDLEVYTSDGLVALVCVASYPDAATLTEKRYVYIGRGNRKPEGEP